jgi:hypothetical protein
VTNLLYDLDIVGIENVVELPTGQVLTRRVHGNVHGWHGSFLAHCTSFAMPCHYDLIVVWRRHPIQNRDDLMHLSVSFCC